MNDSAIARTDEAALKGATEDSTENQNSMAGQLGHRDQDDLLKDNDTDFPEPDAKAEHTGK